MKSSIRLKYWKILSKEMMVELRVEQLMLLLKVFISMDSSSKEQGGTDLNRDCKILIQKSFIINSQFFMSLLFQQLFQQVELQEQDKLQDKRQSMLKNFYINAQFTSIQEETTNT